jgi:hypothetical protein
MRIRLGLFALLFAAFSCMGAFAQVPPATGKLTLQLDPFTSEVPLKKKIESQLKSGGLEWGAKDGQVVLTMLNKRFVNFDLNNFTRYGSETTVDLPAGEYRLSGVGFVPSTSFSVEKAVARGAFVNENVLVFKIEPGQSTILKIRPIIQRDATFFVNYFAPDLLTTVIQGETKSAEVNVCGKNSASITWPNYNGPLKFVAP